MAKRIKVLLVRSARKHAKTMPQLATDEQTHTHTDAQTRHSHLRRKFEGWKPRPPVENKIAFREGN